MSFVEKITVHEKKMELIDTLRLITEGKVRTLKLIFFFQNNRFLLSIEYRFLLRLNELVWQEYLLK